MLLRICSAAILASFALALAGAAPPSYNLTTCTLANVTNPPFSYTPLTGDPSGCQCACGVNASACAPPATITPSPGFTLTPSPLPQTCPGGATSSQAALGQCFALFVPGFIGSFICTDSQLYTAIFSGQKITLPTAACAAYNTSCAMFVNDTNCPANPNKLYTYFQCGATPTPGFENGIKLGNNGVPTYGYGCLLTGLVGVNQACNPVVVTPVTPTVAASTVAVTPGSPTKASPTSAPTVAPPTGGLPTSVGVATVASSVVPPPPPPVSPTSAGMASLATAVIIAAVVARAF